MLLLFFICWIIFAGDLTVEIALFGVAIALVVFAFQCKFLDHSVEKELRLYGNFFWMAKYVVILVLEILKANIGVMTLILTPKYEAEPAIVHFKTDLKSQFAKVLLANSITLTPGTISVSLEDNVYTVHCLDKTMAEGMTDSIFVKQLEQLEKRGGGNA
ncbi:MAG: Na+/H+ antiporter subunit E [Lachnospiraceae bacterium]|nr:Na+/H+ antiporter subunit E [Lachnospiraceae bacterium]